MNLHLSLLYSLKFDESNKVHGQLFRCFDNTIKDLGVLIGNCVRVRSTSEIAKSSKIGFRPLFFYKITAFLEKSDLSSPAHRRLFLTSSPYF